MKNKIYVKINILTNQLFDSKCQVSSSSSLSDFFSSSLESNIDFKAITLGYDIFKEHKKISLNAFKKTLVALF